MRTNTVTCYNICCKHFCSSCFGAKWLRLKSWIHIYLYAAPHTYTDTHARTHARTHTHTHTHTSHFTHHFCFNLCCVEDRAAFHMFHMPCYLLYTIVGTNANSDWNSRSESGTIIEIQKNCWPHAICMQRSYAKIVVTGSADTAKCYSLMVPTLLPNVSLMQSYSSVSMQLFKLLMLQG